VRQVSASAPGKLILLGEYAVLEGAPALVAAVDRRAKVKITSNNLPYHRFSSSLLDEDNIRFIYADGKLEVFTPLESDNEDILNFVRKLLSYLFSNVTNPVVDNPHIDIVADTNTFYQNHGKKLGLGSSAALTVALVAGFLEYTRNTNHESLSKEDIFQYALQAHRAVQGSMGSGIDIAASVFGNLLRYRITPDETHRWEYEPIERFPGELQMLPIWTKISASTPHLLRHLNQFKQNDPAVYRNVMDELSLLSDDGIEAFASSEIAEFLEITEQYYQAMLNLGKVAGISIISDIHRETHNIVSSVGGVYKPSGAGLGDFGIAFTDDDDIRERIMTRIMHSDCEVIPLSVVRTGVEITTQSE